MKEDYQNNSKFIVAVLIVSAIVFISVFAYWFSNDRELDKINFNVEFAGSIERVEYDVKQFPTITVSNVNYYIGAGYNTDHQIEVGDSIVKKKGSNLYKLIKHGSKKILIFKK